MTDIDYAQQVMEEFAQLTGLQPGAEKAKPRRYLWTDAFAVCNFLTLFQKNIQYEHRDMALGLVEQVHETLGRHRDDDSRKGWISGLAEEDSFLHPTAGGLRIGKKLPEREPEDPLDQNLEWDRDGQYYHYLTKWMHALCRVSREVGNPLYVTWARELALQAHRCFSYSSGPSTKQLYWKMSIDLSRPQVSAMGHHDPLDGLLTCLEIKEQTAGQPETDTDELDTAIKDLAEMCRGVNWTTHDPLGLGGLLADGWRLVQLQAATVEVPLQGLLQDILDAAMVGLSIYMRDNSMHLPASHRLAFRELGLAIGLQAVGRIKSLTDQEPDIFHSDSGLDSLLNGLQLYLRLGEQIEQFWLEHQNRNVPSWTEHRDINMVMLATCLAPDCYLDL